MPRYLLEGRGGWDHRSRHGSPDDAKAAAQAELGTQLTSDDRGRLTDGDGVLRAKVSVAKSGPSGASGRHKTPQINYRATAEVMAALEQIQQRDGGTRQDAISRAVLRYATLKRG